MRYSQETEFLQNADKTSQSNATILTREEKGKKMLVKRSCYQLAITTAFAACIFHNIHYFGNKTYSTGGDIDFSAHLEQFSLF